MTTPTPDTANWQELTRQLDADMQILVLISGTLADGSEHYAYASIPPSKYAAFKEAESKGAYDLGDYGKILHHGKGLEPPPEVQQKMAAEYDASHTFEDDLLKQAEKIEQAILNAVSDSKN